MSENEQNLMTTLRGSLLEGFFPRGWDLAKMDLCAATPPELISERQSWWHPDFVPVETETIEDFNVFMGHEVAMAIRASREAGRKLVLILPV